MKSKINAHVAGAAGSAKTEGSLREFVKDLSFTECGIRGMNVNVDAT